MKASAKDLRIHAKEIIETVGRGEEVTLTFRGTVIAVIVPVKKIKPQDTANSPLFGLWADHKPSKNVVQYVRRLRKGRFTNAD